MAQSKSAAAAAQPPEKDSPEPSESPRATPAAVVSELVEFKPLPNVALPNAGIVALENWCGRVGNRNVRVYRGAPAKDIPADVVKAMASNDCGLGTVTWKDLGVTPPGGEQKARRSTPVYRTEEKPSDRGGF